jgi:multicomponent Na+:H+ antiporter subunit A
MPFHETGYGTSAERRRDIVVAVSFGTIAALVLLAVVAAPFDSRLSEYYEASSVAQAHGHNEVNVIIVDFRGLDTLGEITVLTLAAIAASALICKAPIRNGRSTADGKDRKEGA